jgi:hypothetical protein
LGFIAVQVFGVNDDRDMVYCRMLKKDGQRSCQHRVPGEGRILLRNARCAVAGRAGSAPGSDD